MTKAYRPPGPDGVGFGSRRGFVAPAAIAQLAGVGLAGGAGDEMSSALFIARSTEGVILWPT
jgi:hypothetical protein